ncbi:MAG: hypothetical protein ACLQVA_16630 [Candidatus Brocadiia bacterium]
MPGTTKIAGGLGPLGGLLPPVTVRAEDIPGTVQIIGRLGQPLGSLLRIRGKWVYSLAKDDSLYFDVAFVNGMQIGNKVGIMVEPIDNVPGGRPKPGDFWDWRTGGEESEPWPMPSEGETWEILGVETGYFDHTYSPEVYKEEPSIGTRKMTMWTYGFYTRFQCIAVRKVK